ncbi:MAG: hypothetical protein SFY67_01990 [Candidatus Melainabacteria bacterium]|nr:hypothetical protein [Candidatus Melainabacteria bacterium]
MESNLDIKFGEENRLILRELVIYKNEEPLKFWLLNNPAKEIPSCHVREWIKLSSQSNVIQWVNNLVRNVHIKSDDVIAVAVEADPSSNLQLARKWIDNNLQATSAYLFSQVIKHLGHQESYGWLYPKAVDANNPYLLSVMLDFCSTPAVIDHCLSWVLEADIRETGAVATRLALLIDIETLNSWGSAFIEKMLASTTLPEDWGTAYHFICKRLGHPININEVKAIVNKSTAKDSAPAVMEMIKIDAFSFAETMDWLKAHEQEEAILPVVSLFLSKFPKKIRDVSRVISDNFLINHTEYLLRSITTVEQMQTFLESSIVGSIVGDSKILEKLFLQFDDEKTELYSYVTELAKSWLSSKKEDHSSWIIVLCMLLERNNAGTDTMTIAKHWLEENPEHPRSNRIIGTLIRKFNDERAIELALKKVEIWDSDYIKDVGFLLTSLLAIEIKKNEIIEYSRKFLQMRDIDDSFVEVLLELLRQNPDDELRLLAARVFCISTWSPLSVVLTNSSPSDFSL